MSPQRVPRVLLPLIASFLVIPVFCQAQSSENKAQSSAAKPADNQAQQADPLKRQPTAKQRKKQAEALKTELGKPYRKWRDEDVKWIITDEERETFNQLSTDEERDAFIEGFWMRRNPDPESPENTFKEEHYRHITYANEHFTSGVRGSMTDRGRIYIVHGAPAEIESHPAGGPYERSYDEGGGTTTTFPFERWRYRHIDGVGDDIVLEFVDQCGCGEYRLTIDPNEKDAMLNVPGAGPTLDEQTGRTTRADRITRGLDPSKQFEALGKYVGMMRPPKIKFRDLKEAVSSTVHYNLMPFDVRADFLRVTGDTDLVPITIQIQNKDITFATRDGVSTGAVNIFGQVTTISGRIVQTFEDTVQAGTGGAAAASTARRVGVLEGAAAAARAVQAGAGAEGRERRPAGNANQAAAGAGIQRRQADGVIADSGRRDEESGYQDRQRGAVRDRLDESAAESRAGGRPASRVHQEPECQLLDAGLQPRH